VFITGLAYLNKTNIPSPKVVIVLSTGIYCKAETGVKL
jgi:hypothetical protein